MWSWVIAVTVAVSSLTLPVMTEDDVTWCPHHCRCYWDQDSYKAAQCTPAAVSPSYYTRIFPSIQVMSLKPLHKALPLKLAPNMFQRFRNVKILDLSNSSITQIPHDVFFGLRYVSDIDLSYNRIRFLKGIVFKSLPALQTLLLRGNPLVLTPFETIISDTLKELDMGECGLYTIPVHTFSSVDRLTHLSLDGNHLQTIYYQSVPNNLRYLNLAGNNITNVPTKVLLSFSFLRRIDLSENPVNCTCALMIMQDWFSGRGVALENDLVCDSPEPYRGKSLNKIDENELCKYEMHKERQMNKLRFSYKPKDIYHDGTQFNSLRTHDVLMADEAAKEDDSEVLFSNHDTLKLGTHMEHNGYHEKTSTDNLEVIEGSGSDGEFAVDSEEDKHATIIDQDVSDEVMRGKSFSESNEMSSETPLSTSSDFDNTIKIASIGEHASGQNDSSVDEENSSKNQSFEIDSSLESDPKPLSNSETSFEEGSSVLQTTTEEDNEGSGDTAPIISDSLSTKIELLDENYAFSSTTESLLAEITPETTELSTVTGPDDAGFFGETEISSVHPIFVSSEETPTTARSTETTTGIQDIHTVPISVGPEESEVSSSAEPGQNFWSTTQKEVTEEIIVRKKVVTDSLERYADMSTEASVANDTDDILTRADSTSVAQSISTYIIIAVIALPVIVLILMAACRKKSPRKVRLPPDAESNLGTELQDMDTLLPKNGTENGVKVVPKVNGAANPADSKTPEEVVPVLQEESQPEPDTQQQPQLPSRQKGATSPIQKTKAKLTVITDSIPKTPLFIHKTFPE